MLTTARKAPEDFVQDLVPPDDVLGCQAAIAGGERAVCAGPQSFGYDLKSQLHTWLAWHGTSQGMSLARRSTRSCLAAKARPRLASVSGLMPCSRLWRRDVSDKAMKKGMASFSRSRVGRAVCRCLGDGNRDADHGEGGVYADAVDAGFAVRRRRPWRLDFAESVCRESTGQNPGWPG